MLSKILRPMKAMRTRRETIHARTTAATAVLALLLVSLSSVALSPASIDPLMEPVDLPDETAAIGDSLAGNLQTSQRFITTDLLDHKSALHRGVALAKEGTYTQAATLGLEWTEPTGNEDHARPSGAILELTDRYGVQPTPVHLQQMHALDESTDLFHRQLTATLDAFLWLDQAARAAYENADLETLKSVETKGTAQTDPAWLHESAGIDLTQVLPARNRLLDVALDLSEASKAHGDRSQVCEPLQIPALLSIDMSDCDNTYTEDFILIIDAGGNDTYHNNAGGNASGGTNCSFNVVAAQRVGVLIDLGLGDDEFGDPENPRGCGVNGGGGLGVGFLLAEGGKNTYTAASQGTNGGGSLGGLGFILDASGNATYQASFAGTNGGGYTGGAGFLLNIGGQTTYNATSIGTNGGGELAGMGFLVDTGGDDIYQALDTATNGGGAGGIGFLLDMAGDDDYIATTEATNGEGSSGIGFLYDHEGTDRYWDATIPSGGCTDCSLIPKGTGVQADSNDLPA